MNKGCCTNRPRSRSHIGADGLATHLLCYNPSVHETGNSGQRIAYGRPRRPRKARPSLFVAAVIGLAGAWLAVVLWNGVNGDLGMITVCASLRPALTGRTSLYFPPFGSVSANTHRGPLHVRLAIDRVNVEQTALWLKQQKSP